MSNFIALGMFLEDSLFMNLFKLTLFAGIIFLFGCNSSSDSSLSQIENKATDISYSKSDLSTLEQAKGREIEILNNEKFNSLIAENELIVFHLNECSDVAYFKILEKTETDFEGNFKLIHLFLNKKTAQSEVNLFIRKNNLASEAFILSDSQLLKSSAGNWQGALPALWISNPKEGIDLIYEQKLSEEELKTILQTVTL